jgi:hypothetical protein
MPDPKRGSWMVSHQWALPHFSAVWMEPLWIASVLSGVSLLVAVTLLYLSILFVPHTGRLLVPFR